MNRYPTPDSIFDLAATLNEPIYLGQRLYEELLMSYPTELVYMNPADTDLNGSLPILVRGVPIRWVKR